MKDFKYLKLFENFEDYTIYIIGIPSGEALESGKVTILSLIDNDYISWNNEISRFTYDDIDYNKIKQLLQNGRKIELKKSDYDVFINKLIDNLRDVNVYLKIRADGEKLTIDSDRFEFVIKKDRTMLYEVKVFRMTKQYQHYYLRLDQLLDDLTRSIRFYIGLIKR